MTEPAAAPAILTIDVAALVDNWRLLTRRAAPGDCAAVVKANGYGLGIGTVAPPLYAAGCRAFFVAQIGEGQRLRALLPQADARIYVLNGLEAKADPLADYAAFRLAPAIGGAAELERWAAFARTQSRPPAAALHLDTGMNRLGFELLDALRAAVAAAGESGADLLMSHFVSSELPDDPLNALQIARFAGGARGLAGAEDLARQFLRPVPARPARLRSRAAGLRALRRQPDAGTAEPDEAGRRARRRDPADALDREGRDLRLQWPVEGAAAHAARHPARRLRRRPAARAPASSMAATGPRSRSPAGAARWSAACRWT